MNIRSKFYPLIFTMLLLSSCSMFSRKADRDQAKWQKETAAAPQPTTVAPSPTPAPPPMIEMSRPVSAAPSPTPAVELSTPVVSADTSLRWLTNGNIRFTKKRFRADGRSEKDRARLTNGQHPHAIVLACSDSRVPPEIVFDQALGEIYVVRVLGEALDSNVIASIEYAVEHLHTGLLVVMGHSQCGAIQSAEKDSPAPSPDLEKILSDIRPRIASMKNEPASPNFEVEATLNADGVARDLLKRSSLLREAVESKKLVVKSALYRTDSGKVTFY